MTSGATSGFVSTGPKLIVADWRGPAHGGIVAARIAEAVVASGRTADEQQRAPVFVFAFLGIPFGISIGFITLTFPFLATEAHLPVAATASAVALGMLAQALRALWAPLADISLTFKRWCVLGAIGAALLLFGIAFVPIDTRHIGLLSLLLFALGAMGCLQNTPAGGLMAYAVPDSFKGRASGATIFGGMTGRRWAAHLVSGSHRTRRRPGWPLACSPYFA
jgi:MFS family permease